MLIICVLKKELIIIYNSNEYNLISLELLSSYLNTRYLGRNYLYFDTIDSTNLKAKTLLKANNSHLTNGTLLISEEQTAGRGRLDRSWHCSKSSGLLFTIVLHTNIETIHLPKITLIVAASICITLKKFDVDAKIKWPNDIFINHKKICGVLTEMSTNSKRINSLIIGIGLNVNTIKTDFPEDLKDIASSLSAEYGHHFSRELILAEILNNFEELFEDFSQNLSLENTIEICKNNSAVLNREVFLINRGIYEEVLVKDLSSDGELVVEKKDGSIIKVSSGEISLKFKNN